MSDLEQLQAEVLSQSFEAALPCNLSNIWLDRISRDFDICFGAAEDNGVGDTSTHMATPLALVLHVLCGKSGGKELNVATNLVMRHFEDFRLEISLEQVSRKSDIRAEPATLATIFADRKVRVERR